MGSMQPCRLVLSETHTDMLGTCAVAPSGEVGAEPVPEQQPSKKKRKKVRAAGESAPRPRAKQAVLCNAQHAKQRVSASCLIPCQNCEGCQDETCSFASLIGDHMCAGPSMPLSSSNEACLVEAASQQAPALGQDVATKKHRRSKSAGDAMPAGAAASCLPSILRQSLLNMDTSPASLQAAHLPCRT